MANSTDELREEVETPATGSEVNSTATLPDPAGEMAAPASEATIEVVVTVAEGAPEDVTATAETGEETVAASGAQNGESTAPAAEPQEVRPRDAAFWAQPVSAMRLSQVPEGAINLNVDGRRPVSPLQGFGQMWQKTYRVRLRGAQVTPTEVIQVWKENFPSFWPPNSRFYAPLAGISPGDVALINLAGPGGMPLSTGVMVIYADNEAFTLMTPEGHMFSGWITFSAYADEECTVAQSQVLIRANDPLWEVVMRLYGFKKEDEFWFHTLRSVGKHFGVEEEVTFEAVIVDPNLQWSQAGNIWHNAAVRTALYTMAAPLRWVRKLLRPSGSRT